MKPRIFAGLPEEERERIKAEKAKADAERAEKKRKELLFDKVVNAVRMVFEANPLTEHKRGNSPSARASAYLILEEGGFGLVETAGLFRRSHGSVHHGKKSARNWLLYDPKFRELHEKVLTLVNEK